MLLERIPLPGEKRINGAGKRIRFFQLDRASLNVEHCSIAKVVLHLEEDGLWKLNLWAEQNMPPRPAEHVLPGVTIRRDDIYTDYILRNQFFVKARALAVGLPADKFPEAQAAAPVLFQLAPPGFWVERGQPVHHEVFGNWESVRRYFDAVNRIEVEFFYR